MLLLSFAGAQENVGRKFMGAPAPGPTVPHHGGAARDPKAADLLFVLSADQVSDRAPFCAGGYALLTACAGGCQDCI